MTWVEGVTRRNVLWGTHVENRYNINVCNSERSLFWKFQRANYEQLIHHIIFPSTMLIIIAVMERICFKLKRKRIKVDPLGRTCYAIAKPQVIINFRIQTKCRMSLTHNSLRNFVQWACDSPCNVKENVLDGGTKRIKSSW